MGHPQYSILIIVHDTGRQVIFAYPSSECVGSTNLDSQESSNSHSNQERRLSKVETPQQQSLTDSVLKTTDIELHGTTSTVFPPTLFDFETSSLVSLLCPTKSQLVNNILRLSITNTAKDVEYFFLGYPTTMPTKTSNNITHFSITLCSKDQAFPQYFEPILMVFTELLVKEERRSKFLTQELQILQKNKEENFMDCKMAMKLSELARECIQLIKSLSKGDALELKYDASYII